MNIKNYTSTVDPGRSILKIQELLVEIGASDITMKYENKVCTGVTFLYSDSLLGSTVAFKFNARTEEIFNKLWSEVKRPQPTTKTNLQDQARRTAWKILSDWVEIQCTMIMLDQAKPLQLFLPFVYDIQNNKTFYEKVMEGNGKLLK